MMCRQVTTAYYMDNSNTYYVGERRGREEKEERRERREGRGEREEKRGRRGVEKRERREEKEFNNLWWGDPGGCLPQ